MSRIRPHRASRPGRSLTRKTDTRQALMTSALALLQGDKSLDALSLRELTREVGIVPTAFYRHYKDMNELGLALVDESFRTLRQLLRATRSTELPEEKIVRNSVKILVKQVRSDRTHFQFITRERYGGVASVRHAIRQEIRLLQSELATDLARFPGLTQWTTQDLQMLAALLVNAMVAIVQEVLEYNQPTRAQEKEMMDTAERQLRLIMLGASQWRSDSK